MYYNELWDNENKSESVKEDAKHLLKGYGTKNDNTLVPESKPKKKSNNTEVPEPNSNNKVSGSNNHPKATFNFNKIGNGTQEPQLEPQVEPATITTIEDNLF